MHRVCWEPAALKGAPSPRQGDWATAAWSSPALPILWEPPAPTKTRLGPSQRACAHFSSFPPVLGKLFRKFKYDLFSISCSHPKSVPGKAPDGPVLPDRAAARHFALGLFFFFLLFFHVAASFTRELSINYVRGKWDQKAAGINN